MGGLEFVTAIVDRSSGELVSDFFLEHGATHVLHGLGRGTAGDDILAYLGLGEPEKQVLFTVVTREQAERMMERFLSRLHFQEAGKGIAFAIPLCSVGGANTLSALVGDQVLTEGKKMERTDSGNELIIVVANRGHVDEVMDAAREAGARGGTVLHALGTGTEHAKKFFGVSVSKDKDMVLIVVKQDIKADVMKAIMTKAGSHTNAQSMLFTLPVTQVAGIRGE